MAPDATRVPVATIAFTALFVLVAWQVTGFAPTEASIQPVAWSREALARGQWEKLLFSVFAHGGMLHLLVNTLGLLGFGPPLERTLGTPRFAALFLAAGLAGGLAHTAFGPAMPVVGASGALFGLFGLLMVLEPRAWVSLFALVPMPMLLAGVLYAASVPFLARLGSALPIAHEAHLGGMSLGVAAAFAVNPRRALRVLPAAAAVFLIVDLALGYAVGLDWAGVLRLDPGAALLGPLLPLLAALLALVGAFAYLRWLDERAPRAERGRT